MDSEALADLDFLTGAIFGCFREKVLTDEEKKSDDVEHDTFVTIPVAQKIELSVSPK